MAAIDDTRTLGRARLDFASEHDIDEFVETLRKFESGEMPADQWRRFRLVRGTYGQRAGRRPDAARQGAAGHRLLVADARVCRASRRATRAASVTSPRARTSSFISSC